MHRALTRFDGPYMHWASTRFDGPYMHGALTRFDGSHMHGALTRFDGPCMQTATVAAGHARPCALASVCRRHHVKEQWKKLSIKVKKAVFDCFATAIKFIGS